MKTIKWIFPAVVLASIALAGCASTAINRDIDQKVSDEAQIENKKELQEQAKQVINSAPGLTAEQRDQLADLRQTTRTQLDLISDQSLKLRAVLIQEMFASNFDQQEIDIIKQRLRGLSDKRLTVIFGAVDATNKILGRQASNFQPIYNDYLEAPGGGS